MQIITSDQAPLDLGFGCYKCNWGTHLAGFYEDDEELDRIVLGFLGQGDLAGDLQLFCPVGRTPGEFRDTYARRYPERAARVRDPSAFRLLDPRELYCPNGVFSVAAMQAGLDRLFAESQAEGRRNIRASAEMIWALEAIPGIEQLMAYEAWLNHFIHGKPWVSICLYDVRSFSGEIIMNVLRTHPFTISGGVIVQNPYYQDPEKWLAKHAPQFLPATGGPLSPIR
jgi:hypothetical protein